MTVTARSCGTGPTRCTACCKTNSFEGLAKSQGVWCVHCGFGSQCRIFNRPERPRACAEYRCGWLEGAFDEGDRPDKLKLVPDRYKITVTYQSGSTRTVIIVRLAEVAEGALQKSRSKKFVQRLLDTGHVLVLERLVPGAVVKRVEMDPRFYAKAEQVFLQDLLLDKEF